MPSTLVTPQLDRFLNDQQTHMFYFSNFGYHWNQNKIPLTWFVSPVNFTSFPSSRISPCCSIPVDQADWFGNIRFMRISPRNGTFVSMPPYKDIPKPRSFFITCTVKLQSKRIYIFTQNKSRPILIFSWARKRRLIIIYEPSLIKGKSFSLILSASFFKSWLVCRCVRNELCRTDKIGGKSSSGERSEP